LSQPNDLRNGGFAYWHRSCSIANLPAVQDIFEFGGWENEIIKKFFNFISIL